MSLARWVAMAKLDAQIAQILVSLADPTIPTDADVIAAANKWRRFFEWRSAEMSG